MSDVIEVPEDERHDIPFRPSGYSGAKELQRQLNNTDDKYIYTVMPKANSNHPFDWVDKVADMLVNPVTHQLRTEYLAMTREQFRVTLGKAYGDRYAVTESFMKKPRAVVGRADGKAPHTITKLIAALARRGINVPPIDAKQCSFNQVLSHLAGKGKTQEFVMLPKTPFKLGRRYVMVGKQQYTWFNGMQADCEVDAAIGIRHVGMGSTTTIMFRDLETLLGIDRPEIERRCCLSPH